MKYRKIFPILLLSIILSLVTMFPATPAYAGENVHLSPEEGEIGDKIDVEGYGFDADTTLRIYFSSDEADDGDDIDTEVTAYESTGIKWASADGELTTTFTVPGKLTDVNMRRMCTVVIIMFMLPTTAAPPY